MSSPFGLRIELREQCGRRVLALPRQFGIGLHPGRGLGGRERVGKASVIGVDLRHHVQRLQLDRVAAPDRRQRLQFAQQFGLAEFAALVTQHGSEQLRFRRRLPVAGVCRKLVVVDRVLVVSQRLGQPPAQHRHLGLHVGGDADHVELAAPARGAGVILHLERGPHRIERDEALQFQRQRGDREFGVLEFLARVRPFFLPREGKALPQLQIVTAADGRIGEDLQRPLGMADEDAGDRMHHQHGSLFATLLMVHAISGGPWAIPSGR